MPSRLLWSPVALATLYRAGVNTWQFGAHHARGLSALPSRFWPRAVFTAVVSSLAEALLRDLTDPNRPDGGDRAAA
ncbi:MAG TPA: hypothetical protein VJX71_04625 [Methylomirabilota bacterium]|nr:hypothetical protein [Methylomirabilota bacterium]